MNLNHYKSFFETQKYYTSIFKKKKVKEDVNPEGVPEPTFVSKVQNEIKKSQEEYDEARNEEDPEAITYWSNYIYYLGKYLKNPSYNDVKVISKQEADPDINQGMIDAAKFLMKLY